MGKNEKQGQVFDQTLHHIHTHIANVAAQLVNANAEKQKVLEKENKQAELIRRKQANELADYIALEKEVRSYCAIAMNNTRHPLVIMGKSPQKPDVAKLAIMVRGIDLNNLNDSIAAQTLDIAGSYLAYIEKEKTKYTQQANVETQNVHSGTSKQISVVNAKKVSLKKDLYTYLTQGKDVKLLSQLYKSIDSSYQMDSNILRAWNGKPRRMNEICIGYRVEDIDIPPQMQEAFSNVVNGKAQGDQILCPVCVDTSEGVLASIEYTTAMENSCKRGVQGFLANILRDIALEDLHINVIDLVHYNGELLGNLQELCQIRNSRFHAPVTNEKEAQTQLRFIAERGRAAEKKIGATTVSLYNASHVSHIAREVVILCHKKSSMHVLQSSDLNYIVNNAQKLGTIFLELLVSDEKQSYYGEETLLPEAHAIKIIGKERAWYLQWNKEMFRYQWIKAPSVFPYAFLSRLEENMPDEKVDTLYFHQPGLSMRCPERYKKQRGVFHIPFGLNPDADNALQYCTFDNNTRFAAYISGVAGSGKSYLTHTLIAGLVMNYHPDEVEFWMIDFKMSEFRKYHDNPPPHVKYVLLENSQQLLFDIIDEMIAEMEKRKRQFLQNKWDKLSDVPEGVYMPAIFVMIDEFQIISKYLEDSDTYKNKMQELLAEGRAFGFKFMFISQAYTTGVVGLTSYAKKQIGQFLVLKNNEDEIYDTLHLSRSNVSESVRQKIETIQEYQTIFAYKENSEDEQMRISRILNLNLEKEKQAETLRYVASHMHATAKPTSAKEYKYKDPVFITGSQPQPFLAMEPLMDSFEQKMKTLPEYALYSEESSVLIYPGVAWSFKQIQPFILDESDDENLLLVRDPSRYREETAIWFSVVNSWIRKYDTWDNVEVWVYPKQHAFARHKAAWRKLNCYEEPEEIAMRIQVLKEHISEKKTSPHLVIVLGLKTILEDLRDMDIEEVSYQEPAPEPEEDIMAMLLRGEEPSAEQIEKFNQETQDYNRARPSLKDMDYAEELVRMFRKAPRYGVHFCLGVDAVSNLSEEGIRLDRFLHKMGSGLSKDESLDVFGNPSAFELAPGMFAYQGHNKSTVMQTHIYPGIPVGEWELVNGKVKQLGTKKDNNV